jgi:hypothetical protein
MLKDSEEKEIRKMMERISKMDDRLCVLLAHTENADHDNIMLARDALCRAYEALSFIPEPEDDKD